MNRSIPLSRILVRRAPLQVQQMNMSNVVSRTIDQLIRKLGPKRTTIGNARSLLHNCKNQAENSLWYTRGLIANDFQSKQVMLMIHIWMMHKRLITEGPDGQIIQECLFDELWEDTSNRIRAQGVNEMSVNKYLKEVQGYSFRICLELDHVMTLTKKPFTPSLLKAQFGETTLDVQLKLKTDKTTGEEYVLSAEEVEEVVMDKIGGVLWRLVYMKNDAITEPHVMEFAKYVRQEQRSLMEVPREALLDCRVEWGPLPDWKALAANTGRGGKVDRGAAAGKDKDKSATTAEGGTADTKGEWKAAVAQDGKTYYWHTVTRKTTWTKPKDMQ